MLWFSDHLETLKSTMKFIILQSKELKIERNW